MKKSIFAIALAAVSIHAFATVITEPMVMTGTVVHGDGGQRSTKCNQNDGCVRAGDDSARMPLPRDTKQGQQGRNGASRTYSSPEQMAIEVPNGLVGIDEINANEKSAADDYRTGSRNFVQKVVQNKDEYDPMTLSLVAYSLIKDEKFEDGIFLRELAILRSGFDAEILRDSSSKAASSVLAFGSPPEYLKVLAEHIDVWPAASKRALEWDENHSAKYDRRWIAIFGMAFLGVDENGPIAIDVSKWKQAKRYAYAWYLKNYQKRVAFTNELERVCPGAQASSSPEAKECMKSDAATQVFKLAFESIETERLKD